MATTEPRLTENQLNSIFNTLKTANDTLEKVYPGESSARQPIHTVYGGAHLFKADTIAKLGQLALNALETYAPNFLIFSQVLQLPGVESLTPDVLNQGDIANDPKHPGWLHYTVYERVLEKLKREAVEDFRIDFEDGFGNRPDAEEDSTAITAAKELATAVQKGTCAPFVGIRIKPFSEELKKRSIRTLDLFLGSLLKENDGTLPDQFVVTLPKVTTPAHVSALVDVFELLEAQHKLATGSLKLEIMIETTQSILNSDGNCTIPSLVQAAKGRCLAAHFGTYDYTASCNITASHQTMDHPACDFARSMMKVSLGSTGIWLSDGATNVMPVGPYRATKEKALTEDEQLANQHAVFSAWKLGYDHTRHSLKNAFYQGWDLHPAQFPIRYAACYSFFLEGFAAASERLKNFIEKAAQATLVGNVFDDAATGQGLLNYFLRALNCGAITEEEVLATGLTLAEVQGRSFVRILASRC